MKLYVLNFNTKLFKVEAEVVNIQYQTMNEQYEKIVQLLETDGMDIIDYNNDIAIVVDHTGLYKKGNPIFSITTPDNITLKLAGKLIFIRNIYNQNSTDFGSITYQDIFDLRRLLDIQIIGLVK